MPRWDIDTIRAGIETYFAENAHYPTASEFDECPYLPTSRQIQRVYGGLPKLRETLGYTDTSYSKGEHRSSLARSGIERGTTAEEALEPILISLFGEAYVHTQKRYYKGTRNRYDFLIYAHDYTFAVDIFTTDRRLNIAKNVRHKIVKYSHAPKQLPIYFLVAGDMFTTEDAIIATRSMTELENFPNMHILVESDFIKMIREIKPLARLDNLRSLANLN